LLLTLWPVDDRDARKFMSAIYRERFGKGGTPADAGRAAALSILKERRERGLDTSPAHWGTFVVTGL
jgi:CHAT domain-containing protein